MNRPIASNPEEYGTLEMPESAIGRRNTYKAKADQALYVSTTSIAALFTKSAFDPGVWVTDEMDELIKAISHHAKIGPRKQAGTYKGLENDPSRQQIILYTLVLDKDLKHMLFYRRADAKDVPAAQRNELGDARLRGKGSIGLGGHIGYVDQFQWKVLSLLIPGFYQQIRKTLSLEVARIREFEEELGISGADLAHFFLAKAFRQVYPADQLRSVTDVPVGAVHTCICAVAILDTHKLAAEGRSLVFRRSEISLLAWVKVEDIKQRIDNAAANQESVEEWSQIMIHFLPEIMAEARAVSRIKADHISV